MRNRNNISLCISISFLSAFLCGCATTLTFKTIDVRSGMPLPNVNVNRTSIFADIILGSSSETSIEGCTNGAGILKTGPLKPSHENQFLFFKPGYHLAYAVWGGNDVSHVRVFCRHLDRLYNVSHPPIIEPVNQIVVIGMSP